MNSTPDTVNAEQELAYIRKIIADSRTAAAEDGLPYIIWGLLIASGMLLSYFEALTQVDLKVGYVWIALILVGWVSSFWYTRKSNRNPRPKSFTDKFQGAIWGACGSAIGVIVLLIMLGPLVTGKPGISPIYSCSFASFVLGIAYFLSGYTLEIGWLRNIGYAWWLGAVLMYFLANVHVLAIYAGMLVFFQVIPGILLNRQYKLTLKIEAA